MNEEFRRKRPSGTGATERSEAGGRAVTDGEGREPGKGAREVIRSYRDLRVYEGAMEAAMRVFEVTRGFPAEERLAMAAQMRRASRAVCACIGAAWRRRRSQTDFVDKLDESESEAEETRVWIDMASRCEYLTQQQAHDLGERYDRICAQLARMISEAERWTLRQSAS